MDNTMSFNAHIEETCKKVTGILMFINRLKDYFDVDTRTKVVQSLALSKLYYCLTVWGNTHDTHLEKAQKIQNFAARIAMGGIGKFDHISPTLRQLQWLKVKDKYMHDLSILVYKIINNLVPGWLITLPTVGEIRTARTRQQNNLFADTARTDLGARSIKIRGPKNFNALPIEIKRVENFNCFRKKLKEHVMK